MIRYKNNTTAIIHERQAKASSYPDNVSGIDNLIR